MGGRRQRLVPGQDLVQPALHLADIRGVAALGIRAEADQQLRPVVEQLLSVEVAEGVSGTDRVLHRRLATRMDHQLDPARGLTELDRRALVLAERGRELDRPESIERDRDDDGSCGVFPAVARGHLHAILTAVDRRDRCSEPELERRRAGDRLQQCPGAIDDGDAAAGLLSQLQAVTRQSVPAQH